MHNTFLLKWVFKKTVKVIEVYKQASKTDDILEKPQSSTTKLALESEEIKIMPIWPQIGKMLLALIFWYLKLC